MVVLVKIEEVVSTKKCYELLTKGKLRTQDKNTLKDLHKNWGTRSKLSFW